MIALTVSFGEKSCTSGVTKKQQHQGSSKKEVVQVQTNMNVDNDTTNPTSEEEGGIREGSNDMVEGNTYDDVAVGGHSNDANNDSDENIDTQEEDGGEEVTVRPSSHYMEGYTPLNFNMNALAMMDGTDSSDESDDDIIGKNYFF